MTTHNNSGAGLKIDFSSTLARIEAQISEARHRMSGLLTSAPLDFYGQNAALVEFQSAVRAKEVLCGRTTLTGEPVSGEVAASAGSEAIASVLGRESMYRPTLRTGAKQETKE